MKKRLCHLLFATCGLPAWLAVGQQPPDTEIELEGLEQDFLVRVWDTTEGLFPTYVRSVTQTSNGYVWLAAFDAPVRFDGARAVAFSGKNTPGLPSPVRTSLVHADRGGRLWCTTTEGRLFSLDTSGWREHTERDGWEALDVVAITEGADGALFFAAGRKMVKFAGGKFAPAALPGALTASSPLRWTFFDPQGKLWVASPSGVWRQDGASWTLITEASGRDAAIQGAAPAKDGGAWVATATQLRKFTGSQPSVTLARPAGFQNDEIQLLEDCRGNLWAGGATTGLRIWMAGGRVLIAGRTGETPQPQITAIMEDREHNVLVGTRGAGLARIKPKPFEVSLGSTGTLVGALVNSVCEEKPGQILIGTEGGGLHRIMRDRAGRMRISAGGLLGAKERVTALARLRDGTVMAAVPNAGIFRVENTNATAVATTPLAKDLVRAMFEDSRGRLWIGQDKGLAIRSGEGFAVFPGAGGPSLTGVRGIAEDGNGGLWFIGNEGLAREAGGKLELVPILELPPKANLLALHADRDGTLWIGVENLGLARLRQGRTFTFTKAHGLPINSIGAIIEEDGHLWLTGEKGLVRVNRPSLESVASGDGSVLEFQFFNRDDGIPSDSFRRGYQPAAVRASDGRFWFATYKGVVSIRPADIVTATYEPPAIIEEVRAELKLFPVTAANREAIVIPPGLPRMSIRCTTPSLSKPDYVRYRYRLEGPDGAWHDFGTERVIRFNDLKPGRYRYSVWAVGSDGRLVEPATSIAMTILPFFWQTMWFRVLAVLGVILLSAGTVWRIEQRRIRARDEKIRQQEERARFEEQLHQSQKMEAIGRLAGGIAHDFNNLLLVIIGNTELVKRDHRGNPRTQQQLADILQACWRARDSINRILAFSRQRPAERAVADIAPSLRDACKLLRAGIPTTVELVSEIPDILPPLLADAGQVHRVVMNLGTNAAQAVGPTRGRIRVRAEDFAADDAFSRENPTVPPGRYVRLTVEDNGHGMDDETMKRIFDPFFTTKEFGKGTGLGLSVVQNIVEAHDGIITVRSRPDAGTIFHVYFPVATGTAEPPPKAHQPAPAGRKEAILLVDDEPAVLSLTRRILEELGYEVETHLDPRQAVSDFAQRPQHYDLVLTDFSMPGLSGVEMSRQIWAVRRDVPIILYTGFAGSIGPDAARELGFVRLLSKPFQVEELAEAVALAIGKGKAGA